MELAHGKRRGAGNQEAGACQCLGYFRLILRGLGEGVIHGRDAEQHRRPFGQLSGYRLWREPSRVPKRPAGSKRPQHAEDQAVHMEERKAVREHVVRSPLPHLRQGVEVRGDGSPGQDHPFRRPGRPGGVEDEGRGFGPRLRWEKGPPSFQVHRDPG